MGRKSGSKNRNLAVAKAAMEPSIPVEADAVTISPDQPLSAPIRAILQTPGETRNNTVSLPVQLAGHPYCVGNFKWGGADEDFPKEPKMRTVQKYFPHAKGGPLMLDFAKNAQEKAIFERKAKILRAKGFRYLVQAERMTLQEAAMQLQEVSSHVMEHSDGGTAATAI